MSSSTLSARSKNHAGPERVWPALVLQVPGPGCAKGQKSLFLISFGRVLALFLLTESQKNAVGLRVIWGTIPGQASRCNKNSFSGVKRY